MTAPLSLLFSNGLEKLKQGDLHGAEALFRQAHRAFPDDPVALFLLGMVRLNSSDFIQAEAFFRRALAISPNQPKVCIQLAHALRRQLRPVEAIAFCKITIAAEPDNIDAHLELAKALDESDHFAEAESAYRHILDRKAEPLASLGLGAMLNRMGRSEDAEKILRRALDPDSHNEG
jgi:predicted Zn-dependent protease